MRLRWLSCSLALAVASLGLAASPAAATFHLMEIREVYAGSAASPGSEYVELQMYAAGQNLVGGHFLRAYGPTGNVLATDAFPADVKGGDDQSTLILATPEAESQFGIVADGPLSPSGQLDPSGGAVCWETIDCVSWGSFSGSLPSPTGSPATPGGIPDAMALRRLISPGCATLLEPTDDHDNSAADFSAVFPGPRPNSSPASERPCESSPTAGQSPKEVGSAGGPAGSGNRGGPPQTTLRVTPAKRGTDRTPTFRFAVDEAGAEFECRLDRHNFHICSSPLTFKPLAYGRHRFLVRARDASETVDPSPASFAFRIVRRP
ncbi:MAG: hypothetical protein ABW065_11830 [Solirubrobacterales bacterium]